MTPNSNVKHQNLRRPMANEQERIEPTIGGERPGGPDGQQQDTGAPSLTRSDPDRYAKHRWKFLVFGAISGVLMGVYAPGPSNPGSWFGDLVGGLILWYVLWWLWAWSRKRRDRADA